MKGIAHFISGIAIASFFPQAVHLAEGGSFILLFGGLGGILPDTLDFRLARYLARRDVEIDPHPNALDPQAMAEAIAAAVERAYETVKPVHVQLHTIKLSADLWRQYSIDLGQEVQVRMGPLVTTAQVPCPGSELDLPLGRAPTTVPVRYVYGGRIKVDIMDGPMLAFRRREEAVEASFLPWHRRWSHSLTLTLLLGGLLALLLGPLYGLAYALGSMAHILEDQLGYMGSNLMFPFTRRRTPGFRLFHSGDVLPNLFAVWSSASILFYNLDRFSASPVLSPWRYFGVALALPWAVILGLSWWSRRRHGGQKRSVGDEQAAEMAAEAEQPVS
jgi:membrane-bound metal-dependent hydrolase YbcI (DUF457 family)